MDKRNPVFLKIKGFYIQTMRVLQGFLTMGERKKQLSYLRGIKRKTIEMILELGLTDYEIPLIPVICSSIRHGIIRARQISFVRYVNTDKEEIKGVFQLNLSKIFDLKTEKARDKHPYFLVGVNLNLEERGLDPKSVLEKSKRDNVELLTLTEVIALLIQMPQLLSKYTILAGGSEYKNGEKKFVPCVKLLDGIPSIVRIEVEKNDNTLISPTCRTRVVVDVIDAASTIIKFRPWKEPRLI